MSANESVKNENGNSSKGLTSLAQIRKAAERMRDSLDKKIARLTGELDGLRAERAEVAGFFGETAKPRKATRKGGSRSSENRVDWQSVLEALPEQFGSKDVKELPATSSVAPNQIAPAIHRWKTSGKVEAIERGVYRKVAEPQPETQIQA